MRIFGYKIFFLLFVFYSFIPDMINARNDLSRMENLRALIKNCKIPKSIRLDDDISEKIGVYRVVLENYISKEMALNIAKKVMDVSESKCSYNSDEYRHFFNNGLSSYEIGKKGISLVFSKDKPVYTESKKELNLKKFKKIAFQKLKSLNIFRPRMKCNSVSYYSSDNDVLVVFKGVIDDKISNIHTVKLKFTKFGDFIYLFYEWPVIQKVKTIQLIPIRKKLENIKNNEVFISNELMNIDHSLIKLGNINECYLEYTAFTGKGRISPLEPPKFLYPVYIFSIENLVKGAPNEISISCHAMHDVDFEILLNQFCK